MGWLNGKFWEYGPKYCNCCRSKQESYGGGYVPISKTKQEWLCKTCKERRESKNVCNSD